MKFKIEKAEKFKIDESATIRDFIKTLTVRPHREQFGLLFERDGSLKASVTDGDVRRALIAGKTLDDRLHDCGCVNPQIVTENYKGDISEILSNVQGGVKFLPVVSMDNTVSHVIVELDEKIRKGTALIMAGGFGKRLGHLTYDTPKPLLEVGGQAIIERLINSFEKYNFAEVYISLHYLPQKLKSKLSRLQTDLDIKYIEEAVPMGTAGALGLLNHKVSKQVVVVNGDVVSDVDFFALKKFHISAGNDVTLAVAEHRVNIPFGVVNYGSSGRFVNCDEKPEVTYAVLAGIYCFSIHVLSSIPDGVPTDMPDFINLLNKAGKKIGIFPIHEGWHDVGSPEQLKTVRELLKK